jgi:serine/threonine protein kinase
MGDAIYFCGAAGGAFVAAVAFVCCACSGQKSRRRDKRRLTNLSGLTAQLGPMSFSFGDGGVDNSPDDSPGSFALSFRPGELREQISREVMQGGQNVTPWEGGFIMDEPSVVFTDKVAVGKGSYGTVYKALYNGHCVAVKQIDIDFSPVNARQRASAETALQEFKSELRVWCNLGHPCVVQFYGYTTSPSVCIVQEFINGGTLYELLASDEDITMSNKMQVIYLAPPPLHMAC